MEKVIGVKKGRNLQVIKMAATLDDKLHMKLYSSVPSLPSANYKESKVLERYTSLDYDFRKNTLFEYDSTVNMTDEERREFFKDKLYYHIEKMSEEVDIPFDETNYRNAGITENVSPAARIIEGLSYFNNEPIPTKTVGFVEKYLDKVEEVEITQAQAKSLYTKYSEPVAEANRYYLYVGPAEKYQFCIGEFLEARESNSGTHKICFKINNEGKENKKLWCEEKNIIEFYI